MDTIETRKNESNHRKTIREIRPKLANNRTIIRNVRESVFPSSFITNVVQDQNLYYIQKINNASSQRRKRTFNYHFQRT